MFRIGVEAAINRLIKQWRWQCLRGGLTVQHCQWLRSDMTLHLHHINPAGNWKGNLIYNKSLLLIMAYACQWSGGFICTVFCDLCCKWFLFQPLASVMCCNVSVSWFVGSDCWLVRVTTSYGYESNCTICSLMQTITWFADGEVVVVLDQLVLRTIEHVAALLSGSLRILTNDCLTRKWAEPL